MKKSFFLYFLFAIVIGNPFSLFSQDELETIESDKLFVGFVSAGINGSQIAGDLLAGYKKLGGNFGVGSFIMYTPKFSNSIEISYSMKGSQSRFSNNSPETFRKYAMDYVEIPLMFNYHDFDIAIFQGGFTLGRLIREKYREGVGVDPILNTRPWEIGFTAGMTFLIKENFAVSAKVNYSLNNILQGEYTLTNSNGDPQGSSRARNGGWYHNTLSIRFHYIFW